MDLSDGEEEPVLLQERTITEEESVEYPSFDISLNDIFSQDL